jgi:hypothetical protein
VGLAHCDLHLFPVDLELLSLSKLDIELDDERVIEVLLDEDDLAVGADLVLLLDFSGTACL